MSKGQGDLARVRAALAASGDLVYDWDLRDDSIHWFGPVAEAFDLTDDTAVGTGDDFHGRIHSDDLSGRLRALSRHFATGSPFECEYRVRAGKGEFCWVHDRGLAEFSGSGKPERMRGTVRVVTAQKSNEERLEYLATFDELTGHYNKSRLRESISHSLSYSQRFATPGGFLIIDIDNLGMINDAFGYEAADAVIIGLGDRLDRSLRPSDIVGRIGGDAFGALLANCDETETAATAERIIRAVRDGPIRTPHGPMPITVSIGGVVFPAVAKTAYDVMAKAGTALQQAKRSGRNGFVLYQLTEAQRHDLRHDMAVAERVQKALADDRLTFAYQPVVCSGTKEVAYYECLLRMKAEAGSTVTAAEFVPVVEPLGLMRQIDRRVLELRVEQLFAHPEVSLALNISGLTATDHSWLRGLVALLKGKPEVASRLIVEITETAALQDLDESARFVSTVRDLGCLVALDDFGAGYSSFRHLKALTVDMVKIDGSYVHNLEERVENQLFIRTLLGLAEGFGLKTVAECVETQKVGEILAMQGVTYLQGYYYGRPELDRPWLDQPTLDLTQSAKVASGRGRGANVVLDDVQRVSAQAGTALRGTGGSD